MATITDITVHSNSSMTDTSAHGNASITDQSASGRAMGSYTFDEIGTRTIDSLPNLTFNSVLNPITDQTAH